MTRRRSVVTLLRRLAVRGLDDGRLTEEQMPWQKHSV